MTIVNVAITASLKTSSSRRLSIGMDAKNLDALRTKEYWENRYAKESFDTDFDWFKEYDDFAPWLERTIQHDDKILILGCGNSVCSWICSC